MTTTPPVRGQKDPSPAPDAPDGQETKNAYVAPPHASKGDILKETGGVSPSP